MKSKYSIKKSIEEKVQRWATNYQENSYQENFPVIHNQSYSI